MSEPAPPRTPWLRIVGVVLFLASAALPVARCTATQRRTEANKGLGVTVVQVVSEQSFAPWRAVTGALAAGWNEGGLLGAVWVARPWYPYLLAPLWLAGLLLVPRLLPRGRRVLGIAFLALTVAIAVLEAFYIAIDFQGAFSGTAGVVEDVVAWLLVAAVLFLRPRDVSLLDSTATVSAQALLGLLHALTFPAYDVLTWAAARRGIDAIVSGLLWKWRPAFWVAVASLILASIPAYLPRRRWAAPPEPSPEPSPEPT